jgi:hypothetical protein
MYTFSYWEILYIVHQVTLQLCGPGRGVEKSRIGWDLAWTLVYKWWIVLILQAGFIRVELVSAQILISFVLLSLSSVQAYES